MTGLAPARSTLAAGVRRPLLVGGTALAILAGTGLAAPRAALHGWLIGFAFAGGPPLGALLLLLIHALTGGRWGEAHRPALLAVLRPLPALAVLVLPLLAGASIVYPWAADPAEAGRGVARWYYNTPALAIRSLAGLLLLAVLSRRVVEDRLGVLGAGLGLCAAVLFLNAAAYDWLLSLAPRFTSSAFGVQMIVAEMLSALCLVVLTSRASYGDPAWGDLGGLMLALALGESYLVLMSYAIHWYGNLPEQADWYLRRGAGGWAWLAGAGALVGAVLPLLALLFTGVRRDPGALRATAGAILAGLAAEIVWLVAPGTEPMAAPFGVLGIAAVAGLLGAGSRLPAARGRGRHVD